MFDNSGSKLKVFAVISFILGCVVAGIAIINAIITVSSDEFKSINRYDDNAGVGVILSTIFYAAIGVFADYVVSLGVYALGEIAENSYSDHELIKKIFYKIREEEINTESTPKNNGASNFRQQALGASKIGWVCKNCREENPNSSVTCQSCGTHK